MGERVTASVRIGGTKRTQEGAAPRRGHEPRRDGHQAHARWSSGGPHPAASTRRPWPQEPGGDGSMCSGSGNRYGGAAGKAKASPAALSGEAHLD